MSAWWRTAYISHAGATCLSRERAWMKPRKGAIPDPPAISTTGDRASRGRWNPGAGTARMVAVPPLLARCRKYDDPTPCRVAARVVCELSVVYLN